jgi:acylphosphatase
MEKCSHIVVHGEVQGVGFRFFTQTQARQLELRGWCRNLLNGVVEILVIGKNDAIQEFLKSVSKGPEFSQVDYLQQKSIELTKKEKMSFIAFEIHPNGDKLCHFD